MYQCREKASDTSDSVDCHLHHGKSDRGSRINNRVQSQVVAHLIGQKSNFTHADCNNIFCMNFSITRCSLTTHFVLGLVVGSQHRRRCRIGSQLFGDAFDFMSGTLHARKSSLQITGRQSNFASMAMKIIIDTISVAVLCHSSQGAMRYQIISDLPTSIKPLQCLPVHSRHVVLPKNANYCQLWMVY